MNRHDGYYGKQSSKPGKTTLLLLMLGCYCQIIYLSLKALIEQLLKENAQLQAENAQWRCRLGMDSTNSHQPPSSDGYQKQPVKPGLPKDKTGTNGGPAGHKGKTLKRVEKLEHIKMHLPKQGIGCGRAFEMNEADDVIESRQVFDLPEPKLEVTEHRLAQLTCCGAEALTCEASVLKDFTGIAVHDCWSPDFQFWQAQHRLCAAHLLRERQSRWDNGSLWAEDRHGFRLALDKMPHPPADSEPVYLHYRLILQQADAEEPQPQRGKPGKPKQSRGRNRLNRLRQHQAGILAFALEPDIRFTHNQAERDLRPAKVKPKVSGCFRTKLGADVYARLPAAISTVRKPGMNVFATLRHLFSFIPIDLA